MHLLIKITLSLIFLFNAELFASSFMRINADDPWQANQKRLSQHHVSKWSLDNPMRRQSIAVLFKEDDSVVEQGVNATKLKHKQVNNIKVTEPSISAEASYAVNKEGQANKREGCSIDN